MPADLKFCKRCQTNYPATPDYFSRDRSKKDGLATLCKNCKRQPPPIKDFTSETKICSKCFGEYPRNTDNFHRDVTKQDGLHTICKNCHKQNHDRRQADNQERVQEYRRQYYVDHADEVKARARQWELDNPERLRKRRREWEADNRESVNARHRERYRTVPGIKEQKRTWKQNYRARKNSLPDTLTYEDWQSALTYFDNSCAVCGRKADPESGLTLAADHWIPLSSPECPGTIPNNIIPLCHGKTGCNNSKSDSMPDNWLSSRFGTRAAFVRYRINEYLVSG